MATGEESCPTNVHPYTGRGESKQEVRLCYVIKARPRGLLPLATKVPFYHPHKQCHQLGTKCPNAWTSISYSKHNKSLPWRDGEVPRGVLGWAQLESITENSFPSLIMLAISMTFRAGSMGNIFKAQNLWQEFIIMGVWWNQIQLLKYQVTAAFSSIYQMETMESLTTNVDVLIYTVGGWSHSKKAKKHQNGWNHFRVLTFSRFVTHIPFSMGPRTIAPGRKESYIKSGLSTLSMQIAVLVHQHLHQLCQSWEFCRETYFKKNS